MPTLATEVLIVGAGLAGWIAARRLSEAGIAVTCLEQGGRVGPADYRGASPDWELAGLGPWHPSPPVRGSAVDYPIDDADAEMKPMMFGAVDTSRPTAEARTALLERTVHLVC